MKFLLFAMISTLILLGCRPSNSQLNPIATSTLIPELLTLPRSGMIGCTGDPNRDFAKVPVWELPGDGELIDPDSGIDGYRGEQVGGIAPCTEVEITRHKWSPIDQKYYVFVSDGSVEGWLSITLIDWE